MVFAGVASKLGENKSWFFVHLALNFNARAVTVSLAKLSRPLLPLQNALSKQKLESCISILKKDLFLLKTRPDLFVEEEQNNVVTKTQVAAKGREKKTKKFL